ncbi:LLM class flavin-dependent oxidoreductase [Nonomuraea longispora]|uniref:LLM class flavin-dependent oxidoreductase n=1 Tax=Nonomuraea longispora TaxID=1848320 RepID=A0A4R4NI38_9ACTN|nr:LLM class flavin-dependent oxidoreductase [Nonomuraea longispora]TDC08961.1 LLM class flavin-dependent oxidoreductase [Nonomuraea longispora]
MTDLPFRFGVVAGQAPDAASWTGLARRAESMGYATLLVPDTIATLSPFVAAAVAATVTTTLRVGTYVVCAPYRTPETVAWETTTLHTLTGGRFELGLGAGRPDAEQDAAVLGVGFGTPSQRIERISRTIDAVKDVRVLVAAAGSKLLRLAAAKADTVAIGVPPHHPEEQVAAKLDELYELAGDRYNELELSMNLAVAGGEPPGRLLDRFGRTGNGILTGTPDEMADVLRRRRDRLGISYVTVNAQCMDALAPVVEMLAGT